MNNTELSYDALVVTKGPEDGLVFPLVMPRLTVGRDAACEVSLRLDNTVQPFHAQVSVRAGGYRIRSIDGAPVHVEGRRAGRVFSRTLRPGQVLTAGYTDMVLKCCPEGLAATGRGSWLESDVTVAIRFTGIYARQFTARAIRWLYRRIESLGNVVVEHWFLIVAGILILLAIFVPDFRNFVQDSWWQLRERIGL